MSDERECTDGIDVSTSLDRQNIRAATSAIQRLRSQYQEVVPRSIINETLSKFYTRVYGTVRSRVCHRAGLEAVNNTWRWRWSVPTTTDNAKEDANQCEIPIDERDEHGDLGIQGECQGDGQGKCQYHRCPLIDQLHTAQVYLAKEAGLTRHLFDIIKARMAERDEARHAKAVAEASAAEDAHQCETLRSERNQAVHLVECMQDESKMWAGKAGEWTGKAENLGDKLRKAEATIERLTEDKAALEEESRCGAAAQAFDDIAKLCGCPHWDYPGQLVRDVETLIQERDKAASALVAERDKFRRAIANLETDQAFNFPSLWDATGDVTEEERERLREESIL